MFLLKIPQESVAVQAVPHCGILSWRLEHFNNRGGVEEGLDFVSVLQLSI